MANPIDRGLLRNPWHGYLGLLARGNDAALANPGIPQLAQNQRLHQDEQRFAQQAQEYSQYGRGLSPFERMTTTLPASDSEAGIQSNLANVMGGTWGGGMAANVMEHPLKAAGGLLNPRRPQGLLPLTTYHGSPHRINNVEPPQWERVNDWPAPGRGPLDADDYVYHVTSEPNAEQILREGLIPGKRGLMGVGGNAGYSKGKVFVTDANGVNFWRDRTEDHLFDQFDDPPDIAILRMKKENAKGVLSDVPGTQDARAGSYFSDKPIGEGSPMGRFDMSKIGTGEGVQAYGHGIYLAERKGTAGIYQLTTGGLTPSPELRDWMRANKSKQVAAVEDFYRGIYPTFPDDTIADLADNVINSAAATGGQLDAGVLGSNMPQQLVDDVTDGLRVAPGSGHLYTVDLPDEHIAKMLDWDAPLSEQPKAVRDAMARVDPSFKFTPDETTGGEWYKHIAGEADEADNVAAKELSDNLRRAGIPGLKYFDAAGGGRATGEGTRNFVIFDPDIAKILNRE